MSNQKYHGIFPAFYACYDDQGEISPERVEALTATLFRKGLRVSMCAALLESVFTKAWRIERKLWSM